MMTVDLKKLEDRLKNMLVELDTREARLKEELRAIELVHQASGGPDTPAVAVSTTVDASSESAPVNPQGGSPAEVAATMEAPLRFQEDGLPTEEPVQENTSAGTQVSQVVPVEPATGLDETIPAMTRPPEAVTASPPEPASEKNSEPTPPATVSEKDPRPLKEQISGATVEDAVLAVLRSWDTRLKSAKITEELISAGYPFPSGNPRDLITGVLQDMAGSNEIRRVKTIKGTYFTLL